VGWLLAQDLTYMTYMTSYDSYDSYDSFDFLTSPIPLHQNQIPLRWNVEQLIFRQEKLF
jgi:hypothetical protein